MKPGAAGDVLVGYDDDNAIAVVTIARSAKLNAMTAAMYGRFETVFDALSADRDVRCILLRGEGTRAFCVGSDIAEFAELVDDPPALRRAAQIGRRAVDALERCPHPVVAEIHGACFGGGLQIVAACDVRIASGDARFGIPIKSLGLFAEVPDLLAMTRTLGHVTSLDLLLTGRELTAHEALNLGFLSRVDDGLEAAARNLAIEIASGAPLAARWHKRATKLLVQPNRVDRALIEDAMTAYATNDFWEGCAAFVEKRSPNFLGH